jgi:hypothetical protein
MADHIDPGVPVYIRIGHQPEARIGRVSHDGGHEYVGKLLRWLADELDPEGVHGSPAPRVMGSPSDGAHQPEVVEGDHP